MQRKYRAAKKQKLADLEKELAKAKNRISELKSNLLDSITIGQKLEAELAGRHGGTQ